MRQPQDEAQARSVQADLEPLVRNAPRGTAVEVGYGYGESLELLVELGYGPIYGYELDPDCVESVRARFAGAAADLHLLTGDALAMEVVPDSSVDLMVVHNTLQYLPVERLAATVSRVMRPGGRMVGHVPRPAYYLHPRHLKEVRPGVKPWWLVSYPRSAARSAIFGATGRQPMLGAAAPEMGWTARTLRRFADLADMDVATTGRPPGQRRTVDLRRR